MPIQRIRHNNLDRVLRWLEEHQVVDWDAQTQYLGNPVTARRLETMASGADIPVLVARHIEVVLGLPRNWMDDPYAPRACLVAGHSFTHAVQGTLMRILIVNYRPAPGEFDTVVSLLQDQHRRAKALGVAYAQPPLLARSAAGELTYVASFADGHDVDRCWEDPEFQDLDARLAAVAEMIPARALHEASASYMDLEAVERMGPSAEPAPQAGHSATTYR